MAESFQQTYMPIHQAFSVDGQWTPHLTRQGLKEAWWFDDWGKQPGDEMSGALRVACEWTGTCACSVWGKSDCLASVCLWWAHLYSRRNEFEERWVELVCRWMNTPRLRENVFNGKTLSFIRNSKPERSEEVCEQLKRYFYLFCNVQRNCSHAVWKGVCLVSGVNRHVIDILELNASFFWDDRDRVCGSWETLAHSCHKCGDTSRKSSMCNGLTKF